jgi:hypothetical protein
MQTTATLLITPNRYSEVPPHLRSAYLICLSIRSLTGISAQNVRFLELTFMNAGLYGEAKGL